MSEKKAGAKRRAADDESGVFSADEKAAIKQYADEKRAAKATKGLKAAEKLEREKQACLDAIDALTGTDREIAERYHVIVTETAPDLDPKTWYGFPAYARDGKLVTFLQPTSKFGTRYATIGFNEDAALDDGDLWPTSYAVTAMTADVDERLRVIVRRAAYGTDA